MVFVLSKHKKPLDMCTNAKARVLLKKGYAVVHKVYPFTIRLKKELNPKLTLKEYQIKIDPGSKVTGLALVDQENNVTFLATIEHRGQEIVSLLVNHYTKKNSKYKATTDRAKGWIPPSVRSIEQNIIHLTKKLKKLCNITAATAESVSFDTQLMENPNISGVEYQQGTLLGYEIREYLLHKFGNNCQYCYGESRDKRMEVEHCISKKNGGADSIKNLSIACHTCNKEKDALNLDQWLEVLKKSKQTKINVKRISGIEAILKQGTIHKSKRFAAWVSGYKTALIKDLKLIFLDEVELSSGGRTRFNRNNLLLPKKHYYDALCVGKVPESFNFKTDKVYLIKAYGRGSRFRGRTNSCGVITSRLTRQKQFFGFQTGDIVKAVVTQGEKVGSYFGRVAIRKTGSFNIRAKNGVVQGIKHSFIKLVQRGDGYSYQLEDRALLVNKLREGEMGVSSPI